MSAPPESETFSAASIERRRGMLGGLDTGLLIRAFFGGNALVAIIVLALITIFLFREGIEFFPQNRKSMELYRTSGQEFVGLLKREVEAYTRLQRDLGEVQTRMLTRLYDEGMSFDEVTAMTGDFQAYVRDARAAIRPLETLTKEAVAITAEAKERVKVNRTRQATDGVDPETVMTPGEVDRFLADTRARVRAMLPDFQRANDEFRRNLERVLARAPDVSGFPEASEAMAHYRERAREFLAEIPDYQSKLAGYDADRPVTLLESVGGFLFGRDWTTNSSWQDFYGIWPLLSGSLLVTVVALTFAIPLGVCAAIYVNQVASPSEQNVIKPYIEFISAIPSVVIGFFGIAVFGTTIRWLSEQAWLDWVPFFPISERLNAFTAGGLLALMAIPTIFTLAEDAINNVPNAFKEASTAMGATRWQTIYRIIVPTALSGIISAVLLGFGRVIGETMVVLLCAGNRIAIPDPGQGLGMFFEPVHTMTGIIAQEMGEVVPGSVHYRALFCVGIVLFFLSLGINFAAQKIVRKYRISAG